MKSFGRVLTIGVLGIAAAIGGPALPAAEEAKASAAVASKPVEMEFSVVEQEADGSRHVIASPRVIAESGQDATVRVRSEGGHGLNLAVVPTRMAKGLVKLDVACRSWRVEADETGRKRLKSREVHSNVVVAEGKRVALKNDGDERMTLELEVHPL